MLDCFESQKVKKDEKVIILIAIRAKKIPPQLLFDSCSLNRIIPPMAEQIIIPIFIIGKT